MICHIINKNHRNDNRFIKNTMSNWDDFILHLMKNEENGVLTICKIITKQMIIVSVNQSRNKK